ncbi:hypothetical protein A8B78_01595 [Jannaschia sp. EhC01]|nr:hypothetical protein A8B78_01595 [Jannaschia sp. EhC01]
MSHKIAALISDSLWAFPRYFIALAESCQMGTVMGGAWPTRLAGARDQAETPCSTEMQVEPPGA